MRPIILGVTKHARVEVRVMDSVRVRASRMQSKCRDVGDVHQGIVCFLECDFWIKFLWISKIFTKDFHPRELNSGHPVS